MGRATMSDLVVVAAPGVLTDRERAIIGALGARTHEQSSVQPDWFYVIDPNTLRTEDLSTGEIADPLVVERPYTPTPGVDNLRGPSVRVVADCICEAPSPLCPIHGSIPDLS
jgi:hypothetical protein